MDVTPVEYGSYLLNPDDDATSVARRLYGDPHKSVVLLKANPGDWDDYERIVAPNKKGRITKWQEGDSPQKVIERSFPGQPVHIYMTPFFIWNGGQDAYLRPGDTVFVPER